MIRKERNMGENIWLVRSDWDSFEQIQNDTNLVVHHNRFPISYLVCSNEEEAKTRIFVEEDNTRGVPRV